MDVLNRNDETFMRMALREACKAADQNEVPVGAVVVAPTVVLHTGKGCFCLPKCRATKYRIGE